MDLGDLGPDAPKNVQEILGYLNFASGGRDTRFLKNLNHLFALIHARRHHAEPTWRILAKVLRAGLAELHAGSEAFRRVDQAEAVLGLVFHRTLPTYRRHHRDLLFHQTDEGLFQPLLIGRVCEAVLQQGGGWAETDRIVRGALSQLNDYLGHRPVAVLQTEQKIQPYAHEWVCPIPLYVRGVGVAVGPYRELIEQALEILKETDSALLFQAFFDPVRLDELAFDPRAYDFDHPVNKRPNYLFGQWDLHHLDNSGYCRRFVLQQVSLDAMLARVEYRGRLPYQEVLFEAGAVLAGTMLMGSGVSGNRPDAHDSSTTLATLVQRIAVYRDQFYEQLLARLAGPHAERLRAEAVKLRQPLGGARQHFNQYLARRRAEQLQHVHLGQLFARMGCAEAAARQVRVVPVASARMQCQMHCRLSDARLEIERGRLDRAASLLGEVENLLHRAIECGALVDPWNILGFAGQYSLFPALENSIPDHRVDELLDLIAEIFALYARAKREAAAAGNSELQDVLSAGLERLARWWDQFASGEVGAVEGISGRETCESADQVAAALRAWHEARPPGGTGSQGSPERPATGDVAFWRGHAEQFRSPKTYALVVEALLEQHDPVAAMALLVHWLSQAEQIALVDEDCSFHELALRWMRELWSEGAEARDQGAEARGQGSGVRGQGSGVRGQGSGVGDQGSGGRGQGAGGRGERSAFSIQHSAFSNTPDPRWPLSRKFLDYLEANAGPFGEVPRFRLAGPPLGGGSEPGAGGGPATPATGNGDNAGLPEEDQPDNLFGAAYENVTYRDSTDDGIAGQLLEGGPGATDLELKLEAERITGRLALLSTLAELWKSVAVASVHSGASDPDRDEVLSGWLGRAMSNRRHLLELLDAVHRWPIPPPRGTLEALVEYDQRRALKQMLLEQIIATCVETADAARMIRSAIEHCPPVTEGDEWEQPVGQILHALLRGHPQAGSRQAGTPAAVRQVWPELLGALGRQPLLYVALSKGGNPRAIVTCRGIHCVLRRLLGYLPRFGLLRETCRLIELAQGMEREHPVGRDAVTEFDQLFRIGCSRIVRCLVISSEHWHSQPRRCDMELIDRLEQTTEALLRCWLVHSRGVRLSVLEAVSHPKPWHQLKQFIQRYGGDLFKQHFMNLGNLRGILHQGVDAWLRSLEEEPAAEDLRLLSELDGLLRRNVAVRQLGLALEAVAENYPEYVDYNSITTQSDRGEMLYTLLDFLRLRASYDRVAWNLQPVVLVHEVLVRCGRDQAAEIWRGALVARTALIAEDHLKRLARLSRKYGMRLPSIADRLHQRFIRPLSIDRLRALVRPAIDELRSGGVRGQGAGASGQGPGVRGQGSASSVQHSAFSILEEAAAQLTREPAGAGFEVPAWLEALEEEVDQVLGGGLGADAESLDPYLRVPQTRLSAEEAQRQVKTMASCLRRGKPG